jgi:diacylglycerol kinase family enzyme
MGTLNEVLNGLGDVAMVSSGQDSRYYPLGTVNVFARELNLPSNLKAAWEVIQRGRETRIDLPYVDFESEAKAQRRYFAQLAGAGLDARAVELVAWNLKKRLGPLAYVWAGLRPYWRGVRISK